MKPSLTSVWRRPDTHDSYATITPVDSTEKSIPCEKQHLHFFGWGRYGREPEHLRMHALTECLNKREKSSTSRRGAGSSYQTSHPGISARAIAFGRSWPFAAFCYRPRLPVRHLGRDMPAPKPYETNPTPTHSSKLPLSLQLNVRLRWYKYSTEK